MADDSNSMEDSDVDMLGPSDEEVINLTAYEVLHRLQTAWLNEKHSPDLQPPLTEEIECLLEQLKNMERNVAKLHLEDIRLPVHQLEVERIRFMLGDYITTRISKIQTYGWYFQELENKRPKNVPSKMTSEEIVFMKEYLKLIEGQLSNAMQHMPRTMQELKPQKMMISPNLDSFVFVRVIRDTDLLVEDLDGSENEVQFRVGSQHVMRYRPVSHLIEAGVLQLV